MPTVVEAQDGDTLCTIAIAHGFLNCDPLRAEAANAGLLNRPLAAGDSVTVPDLRPNEAGRGVDARHAFVRRGVPVPAIRFVHGSRLLPYRRDAALAHLNVSNYISNLAGRNGQQPFSAAFGFNTHADADPDTFKLEVTDPSAAGGTVDVALQALRPVYRADGTVERHEAFTGAGANLRQLTIRCERIRGTRAYRSRYLRLVTDEADLDQLSGNPPRADGTAQGLFASDVADGNGGALDAVEILDQRVEATYVIQGCNAAAPNQCTLRRSLEIGPGRQRIKVCFHIFRTAVGGGAVGGLTEQMIRLRTWKWYRRVYAQAELAPRLVAPTIEFIDPPPANMLVLSNDHGNPASGVDGTGAASTLRFELGSPPAAAPAAPAPAPAAALAPAPAAVPVVTVNLAAGQTPATVAAAVIAALPAGYSGEAFTNAPAFNAVSGSTDVIIRRDDGSRVIIRNESTTDTAMTVAVARLNMNSINQNHPNANLIAASIDFRAVIRAAPGTDDRMDCYVIGQFASNGLRGRAFVPATDLPAAFQSPSPLRWATVMATTSSSGAVMDGSDNLPFTYPHESGHVMLDAFHTSQVDPATGVKNPYSPGGNQELMSTGTSPANAVDATKRICDGPVALQYAMFRPQPAPPAAAPAVGASTVTAISAVQRLRARGASVMEAW